MEQDWPGKEKEIQRDWHPRNQTEEVPLMGGSPHRTEDSVSAGTLFHLILCLIPSPHTGTWHIVDGQQKNSVALTHKSSKMRTENPSLDGARRRSWEQFPWRGPEGGARRFWESWWCCRSTLLPVCERQGWASWPSPDAPWKHSAACPHQGRHHHARGTVLPEAHVLSDHGVPLSFSSFVLLENSGPQEGNSRGNHGDQ